MFRSQRKLKRLARAEEPTSRDLNTRFPSKPKLGQLMTYLPAPVSIPRQSGRLLVRINPLSQRLATHPRQLALGKLARCGNGSTLRLRKAVRTIEVRPQLPVTHRAHCRMACREVAMRPEARHFLEKSCLHHALEAPRQTLVKHCAIAWGQHPVAQRPVGERTHGGALQMRDRLSRAVPDLERALDALGVVGRYASGGFGIDAPQLLVQRWPAACCRARIAGWRAVRSPRALRPVTSSRNPASIMASKRRARRW